MSVICQGSVRRGYLLREHDNNIYLILKKYATLPTITFYDMNAMGIGQMVLYLGINISAGYSH